MGRGNGTGSGDRRAREWYHCSELIPSTSRRSVLPNLAHCSVRNIEASLSRQELADVVVWRFARLAPGGTLLWMMGGEMEVLKISLN